MPVFEWDEKGAPVMEDGFKYYWVVTLPLMVLLLTIWLLARYLPWSRWFPKASKSWGGDEAFKSNLKL